MDGVGQSALESLRSKLLDFLWHNTVTGSVGLTALRSGVVDGVGDSLFNSLGELLLGLIWDWNEVRND